ncbi:hypothetical protein HS1genome_1029 [Sulfodiicoccus acidiphilus]|uniref:DUF5622 domain-containing protein n=1 Tax=Sulfodiicoccus acidiphilus TaxID=1670455 RepID=A0A348B388_9CREN|nr:DUF5622 domain-containing protein [Sulfodiicoccus acidiphilus]BBD72640.1 hypothetical protein HS1genome_1029 [Sulfodiicoccus acidiphilus]GGT95784.1 hypothetical protein GCM10007116_11750 [Sulfodiicoccus acidiphilus]
MSTKHGKYIYVETGERDYVKIRVLKGREKETEKYVMTSVRVNRVPRGAQRVSKESLPAEVKALL